MMSFEDFAKDHELPEITYSTERVGEEWRVTASFAGMHFMAKDEDLKDAEALARLGIEQMLRSSR